MYNKKILNQATANLGKAKTPVKKPDIITDPMGQWKYPGQNTRIPGNDITMEGVPYPVWAQPNVGPGAMMQPGVDYQFPGADYVDEFPMAKKGGALPKLPNKKNSKAYSRSLTATNKLFAQNVLTRSRKKKIFDPNSKYYQDGGMQQKSEYIELDLTPEEIEQYRKGGYIIEELSQAQDGRNLQAFAEGGIYGNPIKDLINDPVKDLTGKPVASLTSQEREDIENTYLKFSGTPMPKDAYLTQDMYDTFRTTGQVHGYESPIDNNIGVGTQATIPPKSADRLAYMIQDPKNPYAKSQWVDRTAFDKHQGPKTTMKLSDEGQPIKGGTAGEYYNNYVKTFQDGGEKPIVNKSEDEIETFAYAKAKDKERWNELMDKTKAIIKTPEGKKLWYQEIKPKNFSINELQRFTEEVKDYNKGAQDYERARRKVKEKKISTSDFERMYNEKNWSKFDSNVKKESYKGAYQDAVDEANAEKEKNMWVTDAVMEFTGVPSLLRIAQDPMGTLKGVGNTAADIVMSTAPGIGSAFGAGDPNVNPLTGNQYWSGTEQALDVVGLIPGIGSVGKLGKLGKLNSYAENVIRTGKKIKDVPNSEELVDLWRIQEKGARPMAELAVEGKLGKMGTYPAAIKHFKDREKYFGQWFTKDKSDFDFYKADREFKNPEIINLKVPKNKLEEFQNYDKSLSRASDREFVIPHDQQSLYKVNSNTRMGSGLGMDMSRYEIKNPDYFTQLLDTYDNKALSSTNKKFYKDLIGSVKKQNGLVTERQYNELQRLKTGNFNFNKKGYKEVPKQQGGYIDAELTPKEIEWYRSQGYQIEDIN